jgi:hypothetical protein
MRIVLMLDEGASYSDIKEKLDTTAPTISQSPGRPAFGRKQTA